MDNPSVSIIVPIYNVEPYVEACVRSVMSQTYRGSIECIMVDDCGSDGSAQIVEKIIEGYDGAIQFMMLHHNHNRGLSAARNTGLNAASGDYLFFLDSDDEMTADCLEKLSEPLKEKSYDIVVGKFDYIDEKGVFDHGGSNLRLPDGTRLEGDNILMAYYKGDWGITAWNKLYQTNFIRNHKLYFSEGLIYEDILWSFQIAILSQSLFAVNQITYKYRRRNDSIITSSSNKVKLEALIKNTIEMSKFVKKQKKYNEVIHELINGKLCEVLKMSLCDRQSFLASYHLIRPYIKSTIRDLINVNKIKVRRCLRDFHFFLPTFIAPLWEYCLFTINHRIKP